MKNEYLNLKIMCNIFNRLRLKNEIHAKFGDGNDIFPNNISTLKA